MKHAAFVVVGLLVFAVVVFGLSRISPVAIPTNKPVVYASFYPLAFLAGQIAGDDLDVRQIVPNGAEPHDFEVSPQDVLRLQKASVLIFNGAGIDVWAQRLDPDLQQAGVRTVNVADTLLAMGVALREGHEDEHEGEPEEEEDHEEVQLDPHFWLDPVLAIEQAKIIADVFVKMDAANAETYRLRLEKLTTELTNLDSEYRAGLANCQIRKIVSSHDAFGYLSSRYQFDTIAIAGLSPQQQPSARRIGELSQLVKQTGIRYVFFETLASPKLSQTLADEVGAQTLVLNPIEGLTAEDIVLGKTYIDVMRDNLANLKLAMRCQ